MGGIRLGKILGFEIRLDWSWMFIFFLVVYTLAVGWFPMRHPNFSSPVNWVLGIVAALLLFVSVLVHELTHSVMSRRYGTEVKGITLFLFGGVSQTADEPKKPSEEFWMAIAGPISSLVLAAIFYSLRQTGLMAGWPEPVVAILYYLAFINVLLGLFNLIPGYPLDGGRVFRSIIWGATNNIEKATRYASYVGQAFGFMLIAFGFFNVLGGGFIGGLWLIFIGWFLAGAARSSYEQLMLRQALSGIPVEQVMTTDVPVIPAEMSIREFVDEHLLHNDYSCYPVIEGTEIVGVVGAEEVRSMPSAEWQVATVGQIAHRVNGAYKISKDQDAWDALTQIATENACRLMVMEGDRLAGTIGKDSIYRLVQTKIKLGELN